MVDPLELCEGWRLVQIKIMFLQNVYVFIRQKGTYKAKHINVI